MTLGNIPTPIDSRVRALAVLVLIVTVATLLVTVGTFTGFLSRGALTPSATAVLEPLGLNASDRGDVPVYFVSQRAAGQTTPLPFRVRANAFSALREKRTLNLTSAGSSDTLTPTRVETTTLNGNTVISGTANRSGSFALVYGPNGNLIWGTIHDPDKELTNTTLASNDHATIFVASSREQAFDSSKEELRTPPGEPGDFSPPEGGFHTNTVLPATVKVLAFYTPNAVAYLGSEAAAQAYIQAEMAAANSAYANSDIPHSVQLVGTINSSVLGYNGEGDHLNFITNNSLAASLRDQYQADLVQLFSTNASYCGIGWVVAPWQSNASAYGFSDVVVEAQCQGLDVPAHEMGHNEGAQHDRTNSQGSGAFPYSYGYQQKDVAPYWRTVMAYGCGGITCPRIDHFSNPNVLYNGLPTGIPDDHADSADVAFTLTQTMPYVANYRGPTTGGNPPSAPNAFQASDALYPTKVHLTWTTSAEAIQYKVYRSDSPSMTNPVLVAIAFAGFADDLSFDDTPLSPGVTYYYAVQAQNAYGSSGNSNTDAGSLSLGNGINEVKSLHVSQGSSPTDIMLSWQNSNVSKNKLYRATSDIPCPPSGIIQTFSGLTPDSTVYFTNGSSGGVAPETRYYYSVGALDAGGNETCTSLTQSGFAGTLHAPTNVQASDGAYNDHIHITWSGSPIADYYAVFKGTDPSPAGMQLVQQFLDATSFDDFSPVAGQTYYYRVTAGNAYTSTDFSAADSGSVAFDTPSNVQATDGAFPDKIVVTWNAVQGSIGYHVFRSTTNSFPTAQDMGIVTGTVYNDHQAGVATTYYYWIESLNGAGTYSPPSSSDGGSLTGYGSNCVAGDLDLGNGNCQAHLSVISNTADGWLDVGAATWDNAVAATNAISLDTTSPNAFVNAINYSGQAESSRYIATFPSAGYGSKTITAVALLLYEVGTPSYPAGQGNHLYVVPATPTNPASLQVSDYSHVPLPPAAPTIWSDKPMAAIPSYGTFSMVLTPAGASAFRNSAASGTFSMGVLNSATYENYSPGSISIVHFLTQENDTQVGFAPELVVSYHG